MTAPRFVAALVLCLIAPPARAQSVDDIGRLFVEGINTDDPARRLGIVPQVFARSLIDGKGADALADLLGRLHDTYSPLDYHHSEVNRFDRPDGERYVMHLYARKKGAAMWSDFQMYVEAPPSGKVAQLVFIAEVSEPVNLPNGSIAQKETRDWLDRYIDKLRLETDLSGSILIAQGDAVLYERHFGYADAERNVPITGSSLFNIASGGKMFTALCVAKLVDEGRLRYDDPVTAHLTGFTDIARADRVTIGRLLSHTSGVAEYWSGGTDSAVMNAVTTGDHLKIVLKAGFDADPGTEYRYCNSNYILLGAVIEKVTGRNFYDVAQEVVFRPAGMTAGGYLPAGSPGTVTPLARSADEKGWTPAPPAKGRKRGGSPAGGAFSNAADILKFSKALKRGSIVPTSTLRTMTTTKTGGMKDAEDYGYGFILERHAQEATYGHGGTAGGVNFEFRHFPVQDITLVVFSNQNNGAYDDLKRNAIKLISGAR